MGWALPKDDTYFAPFLEKDPRGFQIDHLETALTFCPKDRRRHAVDGGAHIGTWSVALAQEFEQVLAFEPAKDTFQCLAENTRGVPKVVRFNLALGEAGMGFVSIADDPTRQGNTGSRHLDLGLVGDVQVVPLDPFGLQDLDFLKLDLEGYELFALRGARETILRCKPVVMIEVKKFNPPRFGVDVMAASEFLLSLGYREATRIKSDRVYVHG